MTRSRATLVALVVSLFAAPLCAEIPVWMRIAAKTPYTPGEKDRKGVVLLSEQSTQVNKKGEMRHTIRKVIRILGSEGKDLGFASSSYSSNVKILSMRAWSIAADGKEYEVKERDAVEMALFDVELYSDHRVRTLAIPAAAPGAVVGYEITIRLRPYGLQDVWSPQESIPVVTARYDLTIPQGWQFESRWSNGGVRDPVVSGNVSRWTTANLAPLQAEVGMPHPAALAEELRIQLFPPPSHSSSEVALDSWNAIAAWYAALAEPRSAPTPTTSARATELTASQASTADRIAAIADFAQRETRYVAIAIGIGGYQPHSADEVLRSRFGDCKDKVTLLRSMLRTIGVDSYYALAHTRRGVVWPDAPSLRAFNHVVAAIRLPADYSDESPSIIEHPELGKLLIFDPTDESTPLGELPEYLQDNQVLLVTGQSGELISLPASDPAISRLHVAALLQLDASGNLSGRVTEVRSGWIAAQMRAYLRSLNENERNRFIDRRLANWLNGAEISGLKFDNLATSRSDLLISYDVVARKYAKSAGNLLLVRPRVIGRKSDFLFDLEDRRFGYELDAPSVETDDIYIQMPSNVVADELPAKLSFEAPGFTYESQSGVADGALRYRRKFEVTRRSIPLAELKELRTGFEKILADEKNMAIFRAK